MEAPASPPVEEGATPAVSDSDDAEVRSVSSSTHQAGGPASSSLSPCREEGDSKTTAAAVDESADDVADPSTNVMLTTKEPADSGAIVADASAPAAGCIDDDDAVDDTAATKCVHMSDTEIERTIRASYAQNRHDLSLTRRKLTELVAAELGIDLSERKELIKKTLAQIKQEEADADSSDDDDDDGDDGGEDADACQDDGELHPSSVPAPSQSRPSLPIAEPYKLGVAEARKVSPRSPYQSQSEQTTPKPRTTSKKEPKKRTSSARRGSVSSSSRRGKNARALDDAADDDEDAPTMMIEATLRSGQLQKRCEKWRMRRRAALDSALVITDDAAVTAAVNQVARSCISAPFDLRLLPWKVTSRKCDDDAADWTGGAGAVQPGSADKSNEEERALIAASRALLAPLGNKILQIFDGDLDSGALAARTIALLWNPALGDGEGGGARGGADSEDDEKVIVVATCTFVVHHLDSGEESAAPASGRGGQGSAGLGQCMTIELGGLATLPAVRRRRFGSLLVECMQGIASMMGGARALIAGISSDEALTFYELAGFVASFRPNDLQVRRQQQELRVTCCRPCNSKLDTSCFQTLH